MNSTQSETKDWYTEYYRKKGSDRNDLLSNPGVLFQHLAFEQSVISALRKATGLDRETSKVLDVGCGSGSSLIRFLQLGFSPEQLFGIDVLEDRINEGKRRYPNFGLVCDDATAMPFDTATFDLVMESTMFVQITDDVLGGRIASEMLRVAKPGGYLMLIDWRYGKPGNNSYQALSKSRIGRLFSVGLESDVVCSENGALVPPVGRLLSAYFPSVYFLVRAVLPFLAGAATTLLQKRER